MDIQIKKSKLDKTYEEKENDLLRLINYWTYRDEMSNSELNKDNRRNGCHILNILPFSVKDSNSIYEFLSDALLPNEGFLIKTLFSFKQTPNFLKYKDVFKNKFNIEVSENTIFMIVYQELTDTYHVLLINNGKRHFLN